MKTFLQELYRLEFSAHIGRGIGAGMSGPETAAAQEFADRAFRLVFQ